MCGDRTTARQPERESNGMGQLSCLTITTLVVISLANLLLLLVIILESRKKCGEQFYGSYENFRSNPGKRLLSLVEGKREIAEQKHMAALCLIKYNRILLICGTTIISKYWVLTAAHCCELVRNYPLDKIKISGNSPNWRNGIAHDVMEVMRHANYTPKTVSHNLCLIRVKTPFSDQLEIPITLAGSRYKYIANTSATTLGWSSKNGVYENDELYSIEVRLIPFVSCKSLHKLNIDETMVCAKYSAKADCSYDSGGPLFQKGVVIGIVSFETDCASGIYPRVYTRISYFERWIGQVEEIKKLKIGVKFKP